MKKKKIASKYFTASDIAHYIIYSYLLGKYMDAQAFEHSTEIVTQIKRVLNFTENLKKSPAKKKKKI